jgi:hypothetical protein
VRDESPPRHPGPVLVPWDRSAHDSPNIQVSYSNYSAGHRVHRADRCKAPPVTMGGEVTVGATGRPAGQTPSLRQQGAATPPAADMVALSLLASHSGFLEARTAVSTGLFQLPWLVRRVVPHRPGSRWCGFRQPGRAQYTDPARNSQRSAPDGRSGRRRAAVGDRRHRHYSQPRMAPPGGTGASRQLDRRVRARRALLRRAALPAETVGKPSAPGSGATAGLSLSRRRDRRVMSPVQQLCGAATRPACAARRCGP